MVKYLDIKGCNVISKGGEDKGIVVDCIFNNNSKRIYSSVIARQSIKKQLFILRFRDIKCIGHNLIAGGEFYPVERAIINRNSHLMFNSYINRTIIDTNGDEIGEMQDAIIDEHTGIVKALVCSGGFVEDIVEGRRVIIVDKETVFGQNKIIISKSSINMYNDMSIWKFTRG